MNLKDLTVGIVTYKSEKVIFNCLKSIRNIKNIIVYDNSNDVKVKKKINKIYPKIKFILSKKNLGFSVSNNKILKLAKTNFVYLLSPDTILKKNSINNMIRFSNKVKDDFTIISPVSLNSRNYGFFNEIKNKHSKLPHEIKNSYKVDYILGFSLLINKSNIKMNKVFDENYFLYFEELDLFKRLKKKTSKNYIIGKSKIYHLTEKSSNIGFQYNDIRNWHFFWSKIYYEKKNKNYYELIKTGFFELFNSILKIFFYSIIFNFKKSRANYFKSSGIINSLIGNKSWLRPKI